jgi:hypothetical protein
MLRCALHDTLVGHFEKVGLKIPALLQLLRLPGAVCHSEALADESESVARSYFTQMLRCALHDTLAGHFSTNPRCLAHDFEVLALSGKHPKIRV